MTGKKYINQDKRKGCILFANTGDGREEIQIEIEDKIHQTELINFEGIRLPLNDEMKFNLEAYEVCGIEFEF